jgi:hypothetical protein
MLGYRFAHPGYAPLRLPNSKRRPEVLRVQTSFQDTPGDGYYFVLLYEGRPLSEQAEALGLKDGDTVVLWEPDCGDYGVEAVLKFNFQHPMTFERSLWAKVKL